MGRPKRAADGGLAYHVLNRSHERLPIFEAEEDYEAFERVLQEAIELTRRGCWRIACRAIIGVSWFGIAKTGNSLGLRDG